MGDFLWGMIAGQWLTLASVGVGVWLGIWRMKRAEGPQGRPAARRGLSEAKSSPEDDGADAPAGDKK